VIAPFFNFQKRIIKGREPISASKRDNEAEVVEGKFINLNNPKKVKISIQSAKHDVITWYRCNPAAEIAVPYTLRTRTTAANINRILKRFVLSEYLGP